MSAVEDHLRAVKRLISANCKSVSSKAEFPKSTFSLPHNKNTSPQKHFYSAKQKKHSKLRLKKADPIEASIQTQYLEEKEEVVECIILCRVTCNSFSVASAANISKIYRRIIFSLERLQLIFVI
jgi:DNA-binding XRE family transcriptional regulator